MIVPDLNRKRYCDITYLYETKDELKSINYISFEQGHYVGTKINSRIGWDKLDGWKF